MRETIESSRLSHLFSSIIKSCVSIAQRMRWLVIGVAFLLTALGAYAASHLTISTEIEDILSPDLPFFQLEERYREAFPSRERIIVVVKGQSTNAARAAALALGDRLRSQSELFRDVEVPGTSPYFTDNALLFLDTEDLRQVLNQLSQAQPVLSIFAKDPSLRGMVNFMELVEAAVKRERATPALARTLTEMAETTSVRAQGGSASMTWDMLFDSSNAPSDQVALVLISPFDSEPSLYGMQPAIAEVRAQVAEIQNTREDVTMQLTGVPVLRQHELNEVFSGTLYASILSFVLVTLSLFLIRSWRVVFALVATLVVGSVITTGLAAVSVGSLNLISVAFLVLFFGLGVDFGTHLGLRVLEKIRSGMPHGAAITGAAVAESPGIVLSALCASIGFLSFVPTDYVGLAEFGIISALGMLVAVVITFLLFPALLSLMPPKPTAKRRIRTGMERMIQRHHRAILIVALITTAAAAFVAPRIRLDVNPLNLQNPTAEAVRTYRALASNPETSPYALNVVAPDRETARKLANELSKVTGVAQVRTVDDLVPDNQAEKLDTIHETASRLVPILQAKSSPSDLTDDTRRKAFENLRAITREIGASPVASPSVVASRQLAAALDHFARSQGMQPAALERLDEGLTGSLPAFTRKLQALLSMSETVDPSDLPPKLRRDWVTSDDRYRLQILPIQDMSSTEELRSFARNVQEVAPQATGVPIQVAEAGAAVNRAFIEAIAYTIAAIIILILMVRRNIVDAGLVLVPLAIASLWTVAAAHLLGLSFNFANIIVIPLLLGLGVASTIHIVVRWRETCNGDNDVLKTSTSLAVLVAQLNTAGAFATLAVAEHRGLFSMGVLLGLAILFVMISSLVLLPAALQLWWRREPPVESASADPS